MATAKLGYKEVDTSIIQTYEGLETHQFYDFGEWVNVVATDNEALADTAFCLALRCRVR